MRVRLRVSVCLCVCAWKREKVYQRGTTNVTLLSDASIWPFQRDIFKSAKIGAGKAQKRETLFAKNNTHSPNPSHAYTNKNIHTEQKQIEEKRASRLSRSCWCCCCCYIVCCCCDLNHGSGEVFHLLVIKDEDGTPLRFPPKSTRLCALTLDVFPVRAVSRVFETKADDGIESGAIREDKF